MNLIHVFSAPQSAFFFMNGQLEFMISKKINITVVMPLDFEFNQKFKKRHPNINVINVKFERQNLHTDSASSGTHTFACATVSRVEILRLCIFLLLFPPFVKIVLLLETFERDDALICSK